MKTTLLITVLLTFALVKAQNKNSTKNTLPHIEAPIKYKHSIGSSFFMLGNLLEDSPNYYLLTYGNRLTKKDRIFIEFNTWKYSEPLGTYGNSKEFYPGYVRALGIGFGYQRFIWKGAFTTVQATPFVKQYYNSDNDQIQKGFQLYLQLAAGYRLEFFNKRWYLEPALALKYWPIDTNYPTDFSAIENGAPKHIFEPSLNFGFNF
ncbi:hypothetical protein FHR24_001027 [Wenyingzhuangia heitensis]|uniref:DUF3575 domain-containing protein n=1 Tax=Wenyingzhuangia heitensis TaxID=1487859 RepID=A0ABX0U760_9FLAO|nr:hypothetical protein [Wenyingzhuangia heitensis]NIJ44588.1 hypothetical protein [Wenyingzhuangia heitensis]